MDNVPYQMISNLLPSTTISWSLKIRVTRIWHSTDRYGLTVGVNMIFVDEIGGRIHARIPAQNINVLEPLFTEGQTYHVRNFVVRQYGPMQTERCIMNDLYIQLYNMTEILQSEVVNNIPHNVFHFTELSHIINAALEDNYLIDVVGIMEQVDPIITYRNRYNQQKSSIKFTINDITGTAEVTFHNELAESFQQRVNDANQHPIIVIIASCKSTFIEGEPKLSNLSPTRFFINYNHEAVEDLRNAIRLANWRFD
ncbi:hypothetical protein DCAR_0312085 [Daucus carota subsp. sativus]|uniref:Replication protein A 70 kDa DNA-binding subunit B/D first OB fold domain-containing protein n=1 Tax=Daucus carota subsp. sativus TaxID=79200 RepID=A0A169WAM5_DAUCS|nr:hypothetical protein DCAR_0312085 [Daucus carota subsp. sativus]